MNQPKAQSEITDNLTNKTQTDNSTNMQSDNCKQMQHNGEAGTEITEG